MSYYSIDYSQTSENPFGGPAKSAPFPGWGILPWAAGPRRIAMGSSPDGLGANVIAAAARPAAVKAVALSPKVTLLARDPTTGETIPADSTSAGWPWWIYMAVPMALGGAGLFAYDHFSRPKAATANRRRSYR